jgi:hypothetical protein
MELDKYNRPASLKKVHVEYSRTTSLSPQNTISDDDIVVFLTGPTPAYPLATWSWRDQFAIELDTLCQKLICDQRIILICPEPYDRNWSSAYADQLAWEHVWLERAEIILFWHETRWTPNNKTLINCYHGDKIANIGIQFRFEVGMYIADKRKVRIFYIPPHSEQTGGCRWWLKNKPETPDRLTSTTTERDTLNVVFNAIVAQID